MVYPSLYKMILTLLILLMIFKCKCNAVEETSVEHGIKANRRHKQNEYLKHLISGGQLLREKTVVSDGLKYNIEILENENITADGKMSHCEYVDLYPFTAYRPFKQCVRTSYYEFVSDTILKEGTYGMGPMDGCNFLLYLWTISGHHGMFLDVGGNIGTCSLLFAANGISALAFEPIPANYKIFSKSILGNYPAFEDMILLYPFAAGNETLKMDAFMQTNNMGNSMLNRPVPIKRRDEMIKELVEVRRLDDVLWANRLQGGVHPTIRLMKLDVQGYELKALHGAHHLLKAGAINMIAFENEHKMLESQGTSCSEIISLLQGYNYKVYTNDGRVITEAAKCLNEPIGDLWAKLEHFHLLNSTISNQKEDLNR